MIRPEFARILRRNEPARTRAFPMATRGRGLNASLRRCAVGMALLLGLAPFVAAAQDNYVQLLADRVDRLQQELTDLQRNVYGDGAAGGGEKAAGTTLDANQEVRLEQTPSCAASPARSRKSRSARLSCPSGSTS
jgi:hypothetical protein